MLFTKAIKLCSCACLLGAVLLTGCANKNEPAPVPETVFSARVETDSSSGHTVVVLSRSGPHRLEAKISPTAGANLFSLVYQGRELLLGPSSLAGFDGSRFGTPVLYPTPCRLVGGKFTFEGRTYDFGANDGDRWLHGLVRSESWQFEPPSADDSEARLVCRIDFKPGGALHKKFGFDHRLSLEFSLDEKGLRIAYEVDNRDSLNLPYGFGLHPYFTFEGLERRDIFLCVPAGAHMELDSAIPTGRLEKLEGSGYDLRRPRSFDDFEGDDVWLGMKPERPAYLEYRKAGIKLTLAASQEFTHMIVYALKENPFACVENMTCPPDVQNLYAKGFEEEAHLLIVPPGGKHSGWVRYDIEPLEGR